MLSICYLKKKNQSEIVQLLNAKILKSHTVIWRNLAWQLGLIMKAYAYRCLCLIWVKLESNQLSGIDRRLEPVVKVFVVKMVVLFII